MSQMPSFELELYDLQQMAQTFLLQGLINL